MKNILCATDDSEVSRKAEGVAAGLAKALGAELSFLYVMPVTQTDLQTVSALDATILGEVEERNHKVLQHASKVAREQGLDRARCLTIGSHDIASAVVGFAEQERVDHIVVGSTGRTGIPRLVVGSVAGDIIHKAHCPVTVVR